MDGKESNESKERLESAANIKNEARALELSIEEKRSIFGKNLREQREQCGQTERDIIHLTRISPPFIKALEEGNFEALPGEVFGRGFLKNICKVLDIEHQSLLEEYNSCWEQQSQKVKRSRFSKKIMTTKFKKDHKKSRSSLPFTNYFSIKGALLWIGVPFVALSISFILIIKSSFFSSTLPKKEEIKTLSPKIYRNKEHSLSNDKNLKETKLLSDAKADVKIAPASPEKEKVAPQIQVKEISAKGLSLSNKSSFVSKILIKVKEPVTIKHRLDQEQYISSLYKKGTYKFKFKDSADFFISNTENVEMTYNKRELGQLGPQSNEKHLSFIAESHKNLKNNKLL